MQKCFSQRGFTSVQIILFIVVGLMIVGGIIGGVIYFSRQPQGIESLSKCGDGICDNIGENKNACSQDCGRDLIEEKDTGVEDGGDVSSEQKTDDIVISYKTSGSPFGIGISNASDISYVKDLGLKSIRLAGPSGAIWDLIKSQGYGQLDRIVYDAYKDNLEISVVVLAGNPAGENKLLDFSSFMTSLAERYDGDGKSDASGSPRVTYWEIDNEPDLYEGTGEKTSWHGEVSETADYAKVLKTAYEAIKSADKNSNVAIASMAYNLDYYEAIFKELEKLKSKSSDKFFDVFNYHYYGSFDDYGVLGVDQSKDVIQASPSLSDIKELLKKYNYSDDGMLATEIGTIVKPNSENTEKLHAISLIKKYVYPIVHGVSGLYWLNIKANGDGPFDKLSLVASDSTKRLNYYSYKLMVEKLNGFDWSNIQIMQEKDGIYIYKFIKNNKSVWVAWNDNDGQKKEITISDVKTNQVKLTEAVPNVSAGKNVKDYKNAFNMANKNVSNGSVKIWLDDMPVFLEE